MENESDGDLSTLGDVFDPNKPKKITRPLNISKNYVQGWDTRDAFRELYQNWKDGIIETFNLSRSQFAPRYEEDNKFITVTVFSPASTKLNPQILGFIRFFKSNGKLIIANANAQLQPGDLQLGQSSKGYSDNVIRCHGEGFKLAALVLLRAGYKLHIESTGYNFCFSFKGANKSDLFCSMNPCRKHLNSTPSGGNEAPHLETHKSRIWRDVAVTISHQPGAGTLKLTRDEFIRWLRVSIDIHGFSRPTQLIETEHGDLILGSKYANKFYVKGLLLPKNTSKTHTFECGYNFHRGSVNRDRQRLASSNEEAELLSRVWEAAIAKNPEIACPRYIEFLRRSTWNISDTKKADANLNFATAKALWNQVVLEAGGKRFYYRTGRYDDVEVIKKSLKKEPVAMPYILWDLLRRHSLIRTAAEERVHLFRNAKEVLPPETAFSITVKRTLEASLLLDSRTSGVNITFVDYKDCGIGMHLFKSWQDVLKIDKKWLYPNDIHAEYRCRVFDGGTEVLSSVSFLCEHIVEELYSCVLKKLVQTADYTWSSRLRGLVREKLRQMPRNIVAQKSSIAKEIIVSWEDGETQTFSKLYGKTIRYHVTLHESPCLKRRDALLHENGIQKDGRASCGCMEKLVPLEKKTVTFSNLDSSNKYFPMVAENGKNTFYGIPAEMVYPPKDNKPSNPEDLGQDSKPNEEIKIEDTEPPLSELEIEKQDWEKWKKEVYPSLIPSCTHSYTPCFDFGSRQLVNIYSSRFQRRFEVDEFFMVSMKNPDKEGELSRYLLFVHGTFPSHCDDEADEGSLLVTQYSFLRKSSIFRLEHVMDRDPEIDDKELLLHFYDFYSMGGEADATIIPINKIIDMRPVGIDLLGPFERLLYTVDIPEDLSQTGLFCRFAVRCGCEGETLCLTPVASRLLPFSKRWTLPKYNHQPQPQVLDFSPGVLGLAEGFRQFGWNIRAGVGFNTNSHLTWKKAYPIAEVYEGPLQQIVTDFKTLLDIRIRASSHETSDVPTIQLFSIPDHGVGKREKQMQEDLKIFDSLQNIIDTKYPKLEFLVLTFPIWVLCDDAYVHLFKGINTLLQNRYSVHMKEVSFAEYDIPQDGKCIILLASSIYPPYRWKGLLDNNAERNRPLDMDSVVTLSHFPGRTKHPKNGDMLTVRELARIQGFPDQFTFYGLEEKQYKEVTTAFPPPLGKRIAEAIMEMVKQFVELPLETEDEGTIEAERRGQKRARLG